MKICIVGAGAIGGLLAVKLAAQGESVSVIARGPHLAAIRAHGMKLLADGKEFTARLMATDQIREMGLQDLVILAMKAHQLAAVAPDVKSLCGPHTVVVTAQNGIPWWYFFEYDGPHQGTILQSLTQISERRSLATRTLNPAALSKVVTERSRSVSSPFNSPREILSPSM